LDVKGAEAVVFFLKDRFPIALHEFLNTHRLSRRVIYKIDFWKTQEHGPAIPHLKSSFDRTADYLLGRYANWTIPRSPLATRVFMSALSTALNVCCAAIRDVPARAPLRARRRN
jgi:hypothetical protein